ncbi:MAG TPA: isoprenylcysteine carboxylmethyltransferase family protein [Candidatus Eisenbacteria bacterium]|nr:isoprenylcysteine carboxylmethyltransferase family protein [Candidatus Eisenbacteria bacterium]
MAHPVARAIVSTLLFYAFTGALVFAAAGRVGLPAVWAYLVLVTAVGVALIPILARRSPGLIEERMRPGPGERDRASVPLLIAGLLAGWVVIGLDAGRFHWSGAIPPAVRVLAWLGVAAGYAIVVAAMLVNRFFSSAVRVQGERAQVVVSSGPYAVVRHPGYAGGLLLLLSTGVALGSWWSLVPVLPVLPVLVRRTRMEDAMLHRELAGYADYAARVRFRLLPGIW